MKEILEHIVKSLVRDTDSVVINEEVNDKLVRYVVSVAKEDYGRIIGHGGKIANSIRNIMGAIATIKEVKVIVDIK